jgi:hypothetical protein
MFLKLTLHVKHLLHSSAAVVPMKSCQLSARENSPVTGLPAAAVSGSSLLMASPVSGLRVRPLVVKLPVVTPLTRRWPVRELRVASMMAM